MASWWNCFIICSQAPVKLKLKMREDLSDKEITDISVSSTPRGGYSQKNWVGVAARFPKPLPYL